MINNKHVIDVRTIEEWNTGHVEGAIHIPVDEIENRITGAVADHHAHLALYCRSGIRAGLAARKLAELGYDNVENYGGLSEARKKLE